MRFLTGPACPTGAVELDFGELYEEQVERHHAKEPEEEDGRQGGEAEKVSQRGVGKDGAHQGGARGYQHHGAAWPTRKERHFTSSDDVDDKRLSGDGFDEPTGAKFDVVSV
jgi:hypothetical protein